MDKSPNKEMVSFFTECLSLGGILIIIIGIVMLKFLELFGIVKITLG